MGERERPPDDGAPREGAGDAGPDARATRLAPGLRVLALGVLLLGAALLLDAEPLYVPGLVVVALVLVAGAWVALGAAGARVHREIDGTRISEGDPLHARLRVRGGPAGLGGAVLVDPLLEAPRPLPAGRRDLGLRVEARFSHRGRRELEPPALEVGDPLGLFSVRRRAPGPAASLIVLPRVEPVVSARSDGGDGSAAGRARSRAGAEVEMDGLRPLRPGAPASRIHWPALARGAGLLERRMLPEAESRPLVVLDPRAPSDGDALDAAVRATASLAVHLARAGGCALLLPGDRRPATLDAGLHGWAALHVRLALLEEGGSPALGVLHGRRGPVLLVLARPVERAPRALAAASAPARTLVVPGTLNGRRAAFTVAGCTGYRLADRRDPRLEAA